MSYENILSDVENIFASSAWTVNNIDIYPENYEGLIDDQDEFCRLIARPTASRNRFGGGKTSTGIVIVKIFVKAGEGSKRYHQIADVLDSVLQNQRVNDRLEFGASYLEPEGLDPANKSLFSAKYLIPFTFYGE